MLLYFQTLILLFAISLTDWIKTCQVSTPACRWLLSGQVDDINVCQAYHELGQHSLSVQLRMSQKQIPYSIFG